MRRATFSGIIQPQHASLSLDAPIEMALTTQSGGVQMRVSYSIIQNQILGRLEDIDPTLDVHTIRNMLQQLIQIMVYSVGYLKGYAYDFQIISIQDLDSSGRYVYGIEIHDLEKRNQSNGITQFAVLLRLCSGSDGVFLRRTIADCIAAMKNPDDSGFHCYRALETLKQWFGEKFGIKEDRKQWEKMKSELKLEGADTSVIRSFALPARHGLPPRIDDATRSKLFMTTWDIVDRYIQYRNGDAP